MFDDESMIEWKPSAMTDSAPVAKPMTSLMIVIRGEGGRGGEVSAGHDAREVRLYPALRVL
jgi:hypothetical protein